LHRFGLGFGHARATLMNDAEGVLQGHIPVLGLLEPVGLGFILRHPVPLAYMAPRAFWARRVSVFRGFSIPAPRLGVVFGHARAF
jgi:hypothetical protein